MSINAIKTQNSPTYLNVPKHVVLKTDLFNICYSSWMLLKTIFFFLNPKMNWVCEEAWKGSFSQSLFFVGATIGTLAFGWISDHYGRYRVS